MQEAGGLSSLAFAALVLILVIRARNALKVPAARLSWLASGVGALALFARGLIIPLPVLDGWLGGSNLINLIQNVFATVAFWLVMQAVLTQGKSTLSQLRWWPVVAGIAIFSTAFFCIDRGPTATDFIVARSDQVALLVYAGVYMVGIASICLSLIVKVSRGRSWSYWPLIGGAALVAAGSAVEIVFLAAQCFAWWSIGIRELLGSLFDPLFYPGVLLIASGIALLSLQRVRRSRRFRATIRSLEQFMKQQGIPIPPGPDGRDRSSGGEALLGHLYDLVIVVHDYDQMGRISLNERDRAFVATADRTISVELMGSIRGSNVVDGWSALDEVRSSRFETK